MLKSLHVTNFQSHKNSTLDFSEGVNIILGASDSGKTAIIRALRKLIFNKPSGDQMLSNWGGKMKIELTTDNAQITYSKDKEQEYILNGTSFKAFGTEVPREISDALNISDINIQNQLDSVFLLSQSPGEVASFFNRVANLDKIDTGTQKVNSLIRELNADIKYAEGQEVALIESLKQFEFLDKLEIDVEVLEEQEKQLINLSNQRNKLNNTLVNLRLVKIEIESTSKILVLEKPLNEIFILKEEKSRLESERNKLDKLINQIQRMQVEIDEQKGLLVLETPVLNLMKLMEERRMLVDGRNLLFKTIETVRGISDRIKNGNAYIDTQNALFEKELGDVCPLCNQPIKK
jgi:exonuclease SbcC